MAINIRVNQHNDFLPFKIIKLFRAPEIKNKLQIYIKIFLVKFL